MAGRKGDITMMVTQNNTTRNLTLESIDESLGKVQPVLGYAAEEMIGQPFRNYLPPQVNEQIEDYLEYDATGRDLADVLSRVRNFGLMNKNGKPIQFKMRIQRDIAVDANARFQLLMRSEDKVSEGVLQELVRIKELGDSDATTDLPDTESFFKAATVVQRGVKDGNTLASLAIIEIDNFGLLVKDHNETTIEGLLKEVAMRCVQAFRGADMVGYAGGGRFGVLLLEADSTSAQIPLQRLRSLVANTPLNLSGANVTCTLSIAFCPLQTEASAEESIHRCEEVLGDHQGKGNQVYPA